MLFILISSFNSYAIDSLNNKISIDNLEKLKTMVKFPFYPKNHIGFNLSTIISSDYGNRFHPILGRNKFHNGIDIKMRYEAVRSVMLGKIKSTGYNKASGYYIIIEHLNKITTSYCHLSEIKCEEGDIVLPGQTIGISGSTGRSTGPHLHFVVKYNGKTIDPLKLLEIIFDNTYKNERLQSYSKD